MVTRMCPIPYVAFQSFFSVFTQISPALETLGWKILVNIEPGSFVRQPDANDKTQRNVHFGGAAGNSSVNLNLTRK